jgi:hypothetical protein
MLNLRNEYSCHIYKNKISINKDRDICGGDAIINGTDYDIVLEEGLYDLKLMETIKFLMDNILLWIVISIFVLIVWSVMMGDPGSSDLSNHTVICGLIALPIITILFNNW